MKTAQRTMLVAVVLALPYLVIGLFSQGPHAGKVLQGGSSSSFRRRWSAPGCGGAARQRPQCSWSLPYRSRPGMACPRESATGGSSAHSTPRTRGKA
jgi:hypothetical protein